MRALRPSGRFCASSFILLRLRTFCSKRRRPQALTCLEIAAQAAPSNPYVSYDLARAQALNGQNKEALITLQTAVEKGFNDADRVEGDRAFEGLRAEADYKKALAKMRGGKAQAEATP